MPQLTNRRCKVTVNLPFVKDYVSGETVQGHQDALEINGGDSQGMRVQFTIKKTAEKEPNTGEVTITNLAEFTREALTAMGKGAAVTLDAGYESTGIARIFRGDVRSVDHVREGADWNTVIKCADGMRGYQFARVNESFAAGTAAADIVERLVEKLGLEVGSNIDAVTPGMLKVFQHGYTVRGPASRSLERLLKSMQYSWSIQDGAIQIRKDGEPVPEDHIPVISPSSGLIGSPEMGTPEHKKKPALLKFKSLLIPTKPGRMVRLECERYHGFVTLKKVEMKGDTSGGDWNNEMQGQISGK